MTFTYDAAKKIVAHYNFLIGEPIGKDYAITSIIIAPTDKYQYLAFSKSYAINRDNDFALLNSGYDKNKVEIFLVHHDFSLLIRYDLDDYLTKKGLIKIY